MSSPSPLERLPPEIIELILLEISDPQSLLAAISCMVFNPCFCEKSDSISAQVLRNHLGVDVLPEAVAAFESSRLRPHDESFVNEMYNFRDQYLIRRQGPCKSLALWKALRIAKLHYFVTQLTDRFLFDTASRGPLHGGVSAVTHQERCRVERTFYHFEVYCNIFKNEWSGEPRGGIGCLIPRNSTVSEHQTDFFFTNFAPWEIEQLGCIYDFLDRLVSRGQLAYRSVKVTK